MLNIDETGYSLKHLICWIFN